MLRIKYNNIRRHSRSILNFRCVDRRYSSETSLPRQADVVIIGGGVIGCSTFYHLTKRGIKAILLEKHKVTSGTTWHSAAMVWSLRGNDVDTLLLKRTRDLLGSLEQETGVDPGWNQCGGIFVARTDERLEEIKRIHTLGHFFNIESRMLSPNEVQKLSPIIDSKKIRGGVWCPSDGYTEPSMYCSALVKGAINNGGVLYENTPVVNILTEATMNNEKKIIGVQTKKGTIKTGVVVNTCGAWSQNITRMMGLNIPLTPIKHGYVLTGSVPEARGSPQVRDQDGSFYYRVQGDAILIGVYEHNPEIIKELPDDMEFGLFDLDKSLFEPYIKKSYELCPSFEKAGLRKDIYGMETFTPDHNALMGEDPKCVGLFHGSGFNSLGMQLSGGAGDQLASWVDLGRPELPLHKYDIRRFTQIHRQDRAWITETSHEAYATSYNIRYIHDQPLAGRNHRIGAFHEALVASGAVMESALSWERPAYFIKDRTAPVRGYDWYGNYGHVDNEDKRYEKELEEDYSFDFSKHHELIKEEALAARNNVALFDLSSYTKMYLAGPDAEEAADWLFTADLGEPGSANYTCSLNSRAGIEADVTVIPLEEGGGTLVGPILKGKGYYIVAEAKSGYLIKSHFRKQLYKKNFKSLVTEMTGRIGILSIQGPKSGELLQSITEHPITDEKIPYGMSKLIKISGHTCRILRVSYIGELGFEVHIPFASCVPVFNKIVDAGRGFEMKHAGFRAYDSLVCEKGNYLINHDLRIDDNPVEAGLTRLCRKDGQYLGKQMVEKAKQEGVKKQRVFFTLQDRVAVFGFETIWRDDQIVGYLRRGEYGFSLDSSIGVGYVEHPSGKVVDTEFLKSGSYQIEVRDKKYPATLFLNSPFDPTNQRLLGRYEHEFEEQSHFED